MRNGDISNDVPKRIIVTTDTFVLLETKLYKKRKLSFKKYTHKNVSFKREILSRLYLFNDRTPFNLELVSFDFEIEELSKIVEELDKAGTNPFRYHSSYPSIEKLVAELPFRPEVAGVLDRPDRLLRYGHWGMDMTQL